MSELLQVDNLSAGYGEAVVLQDVSFSLAEGETLAQDHLDGHPGGRHAATRRQHAAGRRFAEPAGGA